MIGRSSRVKFVPSVLQAKPMELVLLEFCARYSKKMVSFNTIAVGLNRKADSKLTFGLGVRIGFPANLLNGRMG